MRVPLRRWWLTVHRWLGLTAGLLFAFLGLTGSLLVFDHAIDEWLNPQLLLTTPAGLRQPLDKVIAAAQRAYSAGEDVEPFAVYAPRVANGVWLVRFQSGSGETLRRTEVYVDPYTAQVTGQRVWGKYLMSTIYKLHYTLLGGDRGETIVGIAGLLLLISITSGLCLWWPLWNGGWRAALALRGGDRLNYDLHKLIGMGSSLLLAISAATGAYMVFSTWVKPVVKVFSDETVAPADLNSAAAGRSPAITADQAVALAQQHFPGASFSRFHPLNSAGVYEVVLRQPGEMQRSFGRTRVWIDGATGRIMAMLDPRNATAADRYFAAQFPLHNGEAFGLVGRWLVFLTGLAPTVLYVTGLRLWWRKRRSRQRQQLLRELEEARVQTTVRIEEIAHA